VIARAPLDWLLHGFALRTADTQTTTAERACLARHAAGRRSLVELGVMHGASTRLLCEAMAPDGTLTAVDPFPVGRLHVSFEFAIARREVSRAPARNVVWRRELSHAVGAAWTVPVDFLFIDGDHSRGGIERDWMAWRGWVAPGGVVLLHDSRPLEGRPVLDSVHYTNEVILKDPHFVCVEAVDSLTVLRRIEDGLEAVVAR
jgi:predicted O-methyltransferase YrrM